MTLAEVNAKLNTIGLPVAYMAFKTSTSPPFIAYYVDGENFRGSDYQHSIVQRSLIIELYSDIKNETTEKAIEDLFPGYEITKSEVWISSENMLQVTFNINYVFKR